MINTNTYKRISKMPLWYAFELIFSSLIVFICLTSCQNTTSDNKRLKIEEVAINNEVFFNYWGKQDFKTKVLLNFIDSTRINIQEFFHKSDTCTASGNYQFNKTEQTLYINLNELKDCAKKGSQLAVFDSVYFKFRKKRRGTSNITMTFINRDGEIRILYDWHLLIDWPNDSKWFK